MCQDVGDISSKILSIRLPTKFTLSFSRVKGFLCYTISYSLSELHSFRCTKKRTSISVLRIHLPNSRYLYNFHFDLCLLSNCTFDDCTIFHPNLSPFSFSSRRTFTVSVYCCARCASESFQSRNRSRNK